jgi:hypothetical protein
MVTRIRFGLAIVAAILFGTTLSNGAARAGEDGSLVQIFNAVCVRPADPAGRNAAADAYGLVTPPEPFRSGPPGGKGETLELFVSKAVEGRMLFLYALVGPIPGVEHRSGLTCTAVLSPGDPAALADVGSALGMSFATDRSGSESVVFEETSDGRRFLNVDDDAAIDAAMRRGRLSMIFFRRSNSLARANAIHLLRTLGP